jgi:UDP-N-acetyl-D-glucosamine dehydrogenase
MAVMCRALGLDVWEVIEAAATKPFGFMPFRPGPGVGGHCIPVDPMYLSWKVRQHGATSRFISLARDINAGMPAYVVSRVQELLNDVGRAVRGSDVLLIGVTYKPDLADLRESPALEVLRRLRELGAQVRYADPYVDDLDVPAVQVADMAQAAGAADCVVLLTPHTDVDHDGVAAAARLLLDTRGVVRLRAPHVHTL